MCVYLAALNEFAQFVFCVCVRERESERERAIREREREKKRESRKRCLKLATEQAPSIQTLEWLLKIK